MKKFFSIVRDIFVTLILIGLTTASICGVVFAMYINQYVAPKAEIDIDAITLNLTSVVYYEDPETGVFKELESLHGTQNRLFAEFEDIPEYLGNAFVSIEDERFYTHDGVDWKRTVGAAVNWLVPMRSDFGGSTITQQLVKNITTDDDYSVTRKITEIMRALNLDSRLEKETILELYMNTIYLGRGSYGVQTAAQTYFGKELEDLNLAECAIIAGITKNPSLYDPFKYPENIKTRQETILNQMASLGYVTQEEANEAKKYELVYKQSDYDKKLESSQSYFVDHLVEDLIVDIMEKYDYSETMATQMLYSGGLQIYCTVDPTVQSAMEDVFENEDNFPDIEGKDGELPQASMVVIDPYTGQIKGLVGGRGEKEGDRVLNRATQTTRQPGSAIKPIGVYAPAFEMGLITPITVFDDAPFNFSVSSNGWPKNSYSGYRGRVTILDAVADSINTVAVKVLDQITPQAAFNFMKTNLNVDTLVDSLTLSNGQVKTDITLSSLSLGGLTKGMTVLDMTASYVPFVNEGLYFEPVSYTKVLDSKGEVILENEGIPEQALSDPDTVFYMRDVLTEVLISGTATSAKVTNMETLGKTGTTSDNHDRWFVGATPYYVGAAWFGYDNPQSVYGVKGNPAQNLWKPVMETIHDGLEPKKFEQPDDFVSVSYCLDSGLLATDACKDDRRGSRVSSIRLAPEDVPTESCNLHTYVPIDITTGGIGTIYCPQDKIEYRSLLDLTRLFEKPIYLKDELYTVHYQNPPIGEGVNALRVQNAADVPTYTGVACTVHNKETYDAEHPENFGGLFDDLLGLGGTENKLPESLGEGSLLLPPKSDADDVVIPDAIVPEEPQVIPPVEGDDTPDDNNSPDDVSPDGNNGGGGDIGVIPTPTPNPDANTDVDTGSPDEPNTFDPTDPESGL